MDKDYESKRSPFQFPGEKQNDLLSSHIQKKDFHRTTTELGEDSQILALETEEERLRRESTQQKISAKGEPPLPKFTSPKTKNLPR